VSKLGTGSHSLVVSGDSDEIRQELTGRKKRTAEVRGRGGGRQSRHSFRSQTQWLAQLLWEPGVQDELEGGSN